MDRTRFLFFETKVVATLCLLLLACTPILAASCSTSKCYTDAYNSVDSTAFPLVNRVDGIFNKLRSTVGLKKTNRAKLLVIDASGYPWAVALSDNTIVLTTGAIRKMYQGNDYALADARIAFVLGHELSHLVTDDLFHHRAFAATRVPEGDSADWQRSSPADENRADFNGYLFATISGYETQQLLRKKNNFFNSWLNQLGVVEGNSHPDMTKRADFIRARFSTLQAEIPYYKFAVMLAHFGHYKDAQLLFEDYLNNVETQQAYSNLGYVYLQRAREEMPDSLSYKYWIPTLLEPGSGLETNRSRSLFQRSIPVAAINLLEMAETKLKLAVEMNSDDLASHINLAATYLFLPNKIHHAYAAIRDARNTPLGKNPSVAIQLESIYQLIRAADDDDNGDRWPKARDKLAEIARQDDAPENLLYNLSRMLDSRGRSGAATRYWKLLYQKLPKLPRIYQIQVCLRLGLDSCNESITAKNTVMQFAPEMATGKVPIGQDIRYPAARKYLEKHWSNHVAPRKELEDLNAVVYSNSGGDKLMVLDHYIEMLVKNVPDDTYFASIENLVDTFGPPQASLPTSGGFILSYGSDWSALVEDSRVTEIWLSGLSKAAQTR